MNNRQDNSGNIRLSLSDQVCAVVVVLLIFLAYGPSITGNFGFADDYLVLAQEGSKLPAQWRLGRPVTGILMDLGFGLVPAVDDLRWLRFFAVATLCGFCLTVFAFLRTTGHSAQFALLGSIGLAMLAPFQAFVSWAVCFPYILGAWIAFVAGWSITRHAIDRIDTEGFRISWYRVLMVSFAVGVCSMIYQPVAMFFWVSCSWLLLQNRCGSKLLISRALLVFGTGVGGILIGFLAFRLGVAMHGQHDASRSGLTDDILGKLSWFVTEALPRVTQLQWAGLQLSWALAIALIVCSVLGVCIVRGLSFGTILLRLLFAFAAFFLCYIPSLIVAESWAASRTLVAVFALFWLFFLSSAWGLSSWFLGMITLRGRQDRHSEYSPERSAPLRAGSFIALSLILSLVGQWGVVQGFVLPQSYEWAKLSKGVGEIVGDPDRSEQRMLVRQSVWYLSSRTPLYDEHWLQSGTHSWAAVSMVQLALTATGQNPWNWTIEIVPYEEENDDVDLNMSQFAF
ncbi:MAG: hypothetical protein JJU20_11215 [Opitutales bacterium]|nr:hypothetical protein [Opitutales bacterium]